MPMPSGLGHLEYELATNLPHQLASLSKRRPRPPEQGKRPLQVLPRGARARPTRHPAEGQPQRAVVRPALPPATYDAHFLRPPFSKPRFSSPVRFQQNSRLINAAIRANDLEDGLTSPGSQGTPKKREDTEGLTFHTKISTYLGSERLVFTFK